MDPGVLKQQVDAILRGAFFGPASGMPRCSVARADHPM